MKRQLKLFFIVLITAVVASALTLFITGNSSILGQKSTSTGDSKFDKLNKAYEQIKSDYYQKTDDDKLVDGAIKGMIQSLDDPYSTYMDQEQAKSFDETISASFEGIGAQVEEKDGEILIVSPIKGSPAEKAGIKPRDQIIKVNGKSVKGMNVNEAVALIRGKKGTKVKLELNRAGVGNIDLSIKRDTIPVETVYSEMKDNNIGEIQITSFSETTAKELTDAIDSLEKKGAKGYILDLRGNPGGLMEQAITMSNLFIDKGKNIMQVEYKNGSKEVMKAEKERKVTKPTVVLVNDGTASAAEIMAAALHESSNVPLIGETTFGKGTVQTAKEYDDGSTVKLTVAKWLTADGEWIHKKGIKPQVKAELPDYAKLPYLDADKTYKSGDTGTNVKVAQKMLKALGYKVNVNSTYDQDFVSVVKQFQKKEKLKETGILTGDTTTKLMIELQKKLSDNDTQMEKAIETLKKEM
ncbi:carboxy-terminal processing protease CtpA [Bacillus subtilis]|uniref:carboxy-terminal processing protease CtpA n=1 Tax=Bacillus TaxID=1386 RepID=UPI000F481540|nr:carboxy-terminal processing protease CtpA [Bacillus subtilis]MCL6425412.1 carboxy-terminal processing protease CtpA [Bacillus subtilis]MCM3157942.1 carboxy-terminal processing protease CtpA [Bacillus subtilis]MCT6513336.1 carboxy-terminal processing protease CtpA [Bacillus subtilis]MCX4076791.1 carboxy-terminal processing protease CtpA [Bacillus subtilis]MEC0395157.1 carboxy-terminal processing protease CtpA [Bacillus subtilis]